MKNVLFAALAALSITGCMADTADSESGQDSAQSETAQDITGYKRIRNFAYSQVVDSPNAALNEWLKISPSTNTNTQYWTFVGTSIPNVYNIVNYTSGYCIEVNNGTSTPGERVDEYYCNGSTAEQWELVPRVIAGTTYNQLRHYGTNQCLDTVSGPGSNLMQYTCGATNDFQTWLIL